MAGHPVVRDVRREGREIAARLHFEDAVHDPVEWAAQDGCKPCARNEAVQKDGRSSGLYDFERPAAFRVEADAALTVQSIARTIEEIAEVEGSVCGCHRDLSAFGGPGSKLPSAFAVAARSGKVKRDPLSEHKSERRGADGTAGRNGARCQTYRWVEVI